MDVDTLGVLLVESRQEIITLREEIRTLRGTTLIVANRAEALASILYSRATASSIEQIAEDLRLLVKASEEHLPDLNERP